MGFARRMAEGIVGLNSKIMTEEVNHWAVYGLLDYMAVTLAGSDEPCTEIALKVLGNGSIGKSLIYGKTHRMSALDAALINGTASHAHDLMI